MDQAVAQGLGMIAGAMGACAFFTMVYRHYRTSKEITMFDWLLGILGFLMLLFMLVVALPNTLTEPVSGDEVDLDAIIDYEDME